MSKLKPERRVKMPDIEGTESVNNHMLQKVQRPRVQKCAVKEIRYCFLLDSRETIVRNKATEVTGTKS